MEWSVGELIVKANDEPVHSLDDLKAVLDRDRYILLECRSGIIGYFDNGQSPDGVVT